MCLERKVNDMSNIDRYLNMTVRDFLILFEPDMRNATDNQRLDELMDLPYEFSCCFSNDDKKHLFCGLGCTHRFTEYVDDVSEIYCEHQKDSALDKLEPSRVLDMSVREFYRDMCNYSNNDILDVVYSKLEYLCSNSEFGIEPPCKEVCTLDKNDEYFSNRCAKARLEWLFDK